MRLLILCFIFAASSVFAAVKIPSGKAPAPEKGDPSRSMVKTISGNGFTYDIEVKGSVDGIRTRMPEGYEAPWSTFELNRSIHIENAGASDVLNPRISVNGRKVWKTAEEIVQEATAGLQTTAEKAIALWHVVKNNRFHSTTWDREPNDPLKVFNVYGYTLCGESSQVLRSLWRIAGIPSRRSGGVGHETAEAFYDGAYHMFDADTDSLFLLRDNRTVASQADLVRDHDLVKRTHTYSISSPEERRRDEMTAALFAMPLEYSAEDHVPLPPSKYSLVLRPGESIEWRWDRLGKYYSANPGIPFEDASRDIFFNGRMTFVPDLSLPLSRQSLYSSKNVRQISGGIGVERPDSPGELVWQISSPYVLVGGSVHLRFHRSTDDEITCEFSRKGSEWKTVSMKQTTTESICALDSLFSLPRHPDYSYFIRIKLNESGKENTLSLSSVQFETDFQHSVFNVPALEAGHNRVEYTDDSQSRTVRITHAWVERESWHAPPPPSVIHPREGEDVEGTRVVFEWTIPGDPDRDLISDYHIQISSRADMRWPVSSTFDTVISRTPFAGQNKWIVPYTGLLNPGETYYWRVRARDSKGVWSDWGKVSAFRCSAPGVPAKLSATVNQPAATAFAALAWIFGQSDAEPPEVQLTWTPASKGNHPVKYKIYGQNEEGFTASDTAYSIYMGHGYCKTMEDYLAARETTISFPGNFLGEATATGWTARGSRIYAFYRVAAVDAQGNESGPSNFVSTRDLLFTSQPAQQATVGQSYKYNAAALNSLGSLTCKTPYTSAFWNRESLTFRLVRGPSWLSLDQATGSLSGIPPSAGKERIEIAVTRSDGAEARQRFVLEVQ